MKALHVSFSYLPDAPGGTELYVDSLCRDLKMLDVHGVVVAPGVRDEMYEINGVRVRRFRSGDIDLDALYEGDAQSAARFGRILDEEAPDLVHQHAFTPACSQLLAIEAKRRDLPIVFTYHTPTATCQRGTLLEWGKSPCDGRMDSSRCTACSLDGLGTGRTLARSLAAMPIECGDFLAGLDRQGGAWTALRMSSLVSRRHNALRQFFETVDRFVVLTPWVEGVLRINGIANEKIVRSPHGIASAASRRPPRLGTSGERLRFVHLGRADPVKGTELLIRAFLAVPDVAADLDIYGIVQDSAAGNLVGRLQELAANDSRIRLLPAVEHRTIPELLTRYDMLVAPSQWMETGPLVVLEAFAAGLPVLGSALGGIADKVKDGIDGVIVRPFDDVNAWSAALGRCTVPGFVGRLARAVSQPRSAMLVAQDMRDLYSDLIDSPRPPRSFRSRQDDAVSPNAT